MVDLPEGDILVHSGDITTCGEYDTMHSFNMWMNKQSSFTFKLVVPGNHDLSLDPKKVDQVELTRVRYQSVHAAKLLEACIELRALFDFIVFLLFLLSVLFVVVLATKSN